MKKVSIGLVFILFITLVSWNIYLTVELTERRKIERELRVKLNVCDGDNMIIKDELVTAKDSLRILNKVISNTFSD